MSVWLNNILYLVQTDISPKESDVKTELGYQECGLKRTKSSTKSVYMPIFLSYNLYRQSEAYFDTVISLNRSKTWDFDFIVGQNTDRTVAHSDNDGGDRELRG